MLNDYTSQAAGKLDALDVDEATKQKLMTTDFESWEQLCDELGWSRQSEQLAKLQSVVEKHAVSKLAGIDTGSLHTKQTDPPAMTKRHGCCMQCGSAGTKVWHDVDAGVMCQRCFSVKHLFRRLDGSVQTARHHSEAVENADRYFKAMAKGGARGGSQKHKKRFAEMQLASDEVCV